jgi:hypothetical protein
VLNGSIKVLDDSPIMDIQRAERIPSGPAALLDRRLVIVITFVFNGFYLSIKKA